jgi:hypothetical protein
MANGYVYGGGFASATPQVQVGVEMQNEWTATLATGRLTFNVAGWYKFMYGGGGTLCEGVGGGCWIEIYNAANVLQAVGPNTYGDTCSGGIMVYYFQMPVNGYVIFRFRAQFAITFSNTLVSGSSTNPSNVRRWSYSCERLFYYV